MGGMDFGSCIGPPDSWISERLSGPDPRASSRVVRQRKTIHDLLEEARKGLQRLSPAEASAAQAQGSILIDTRSQEQIRAQGAIPGTRHVPLSLLEWRLCPAAPRRHPDITLDDHVIVLCAEGYSSSLAASRLQALGFHRATDVIDGAAGWRKAGLPMMRVDARAAS